MAKPQRSAEAASAADAIRRAEEGLLRGLPKAKHAEARRRFRADPRIKKLMVVAQRPAPATTKKQELRQIARRNMQKLEEKKSLPNLPGSDFLESFASSVGNTFGIASRVAALPRSFLSGRSYGDELEIVREEEKATREKSFGGNILGALFGGAGAGKAADVGFKAGAAALSRGGAVSQRAGRAVQGVTQLKKGQGLKNVGRLSLAGGTGGALQALGEGSDVEEGAAIGAVAGPLLVGGVKAAQKGGNFLRAINRSRSGSEAKALQDVIKESPEALAQRQGEMSAATGDNVPLVASLKDGDFGRVGRDLLAHSEEAVEVAGDATKAHVRTFADRMINHVNRAGQIGRAAPATTGDLAQLRKDTADDLMKPIADNTVDLTMLPLDDLERQVTRDIGGRIKGLAPRIKEALQDLSPDDLDNLDLSSGDITAARGLLNAWGLGTPVKATVREMDGLRRALEAAAKSSQGSNPVNSAAFRNAAKTVRSFIESEHPAYGKMVDTYAAHSRMLEGFNTAKAGKRVTDIEDDLLRGSLQTPEGRAGLKAGELFRLRERAQQSASSAVGLSRDLGARGNLTRQGSMGPNSAQPGTVTEHLGSPASRQLAGAAEVETQSLQRMLQAGKVDALPGEQLDNPGTIAYGATLLGSNAQATTEARFLARLINKLAPPGFSPEVSESVARMLFSGDAQVTADALALLKKQGFTRAAIEGIMKEGTSLSAGVGATSAAGGSPAGEAPVEEAPIDEEPMPSLEDLTDEELQSLTDEELDALEQQYAEEEQQPGGIEDLSEEDLRNMSDEELDALEKRYSSGEGSPYAVKLQQVYETEDPQFLALIDAVAHQESRGKHFRADGKPTTSSAGAIGVMQVMPGTAPVAAKLAGVPFSDHAYRNDPAYNKLLGVAYLSEMLHSFQGDPVKALAAYNAGPGRVQKELKKGGNWFSRLPKETRDYVTTILS